MCLYVMCIRIRKKLIKENFLEKKEETCIYILKGFQTPWHILGKPLQVKGTDKNSQTLNSKSTRKTYWDWTSQNQHTKQYNSGAAFLRTSRKESVMPGCYIQLSYCVPVKVTENEFTPERTQAVPMRLSGGNYQGVIFIQPTDNVKFLAMRLKMNIWYV